ncbi:MAG TPA: TIGR04283 family arsenosugar biosynthesis glycosyltransferase [Thermoanaerobaculia bacterium]|nr:TIGR04283 family arsenosugar biosynthesis glycosyltransferase [Thermoanaerobaculia bacterium]
MAVSVIIPTLNEAERVGDAVDAAFLAGAAEVIVVDAGSTDTTVANARARGARVIEGVQVRARQLNRGAEAAAHDQLIFVHADTLLPAGAADAVERAIRGGAIFGGFRLRFLEGGPRLAYVAFMINARTRLTRAPWGDQAQFVHRDAFPGYPDFPIMEDYELARRMKRKGRTALLPLHVRTSGRRFLQKGVILTSAVNWLIIVGYHFGIAPARLARWYRR